MNIIAKPISSLMEQSFLDYAMSVITDRALPDVRDGLKPVHRRILFAMHEAGNEWNKPYKKSARMVGDVIGKYHPHGDKSVYDAAVRMAQPFSMGHMLIDGQGNFGSVDGDSPAAMRYTEMRLARLTSEFFSDLGKNTVAWRPNYDGSEKEPVVLPAPLPLLLVNGVDGIAVGMASSIPPHNLSAVVEATLLMLHNPETPDAAIMDAIKAPDFPTGAIVHGLDGFADAVSSGRGRIKLRAKWHEEDRGRGAKAIVIDELPYQVNKANLVAKIAELVREKEVEGIADLRDESNKEGIRVWIALKKDESPDAIFAELASKTEIEVSFTYNCMVLDADGKPRQMGIGAMLRAWCVFRQEVVLARHVYEREQALARLHILKALMAALAQLDAVIATIRQAPNPAEARAALQALLSLDEGQAQAILDMRLQKLTGLELESIRTEHRQVETRVADLTAIIESPERIREVITTELGAIKAKHGKERMTEIGHGLSDITREDLIPREDVLIAMSSNGYIKRMPANTLSRQNRGTRGKTAMSLGGDDTVSFMTQSHSHDLLLVFSETGQVYGIKAHRIPEAGAATKGRHIRNVIDGLDQDVHAVLALPEKDPSITVLTITKNGQVKRSSIEDYEGATRKGGVRGVGLDEGDSLLAAFAVRETDHVMLVSSDGNAIRFEASDARTMGRTACGVRGMRLDPGQRVIGAAVLADGENMARQLLCIGENGVGKRTQVAEFPTQNRGGSGVIAFKENTKTGKLVAALGVDETQDLVLFASNGVSNRVAIKDIRETGRAASGVIIMSLDKGQMVVSATTAPHLETDEAPEAAAQGAD